MLNGPTWQGTPALHADRRSPLMGAYLPVFALIVLTVVFAAVSFGASRLLAPKLTNPAKEAPYECGIVPTREPPERFPVRFYLVAMIFVVFDIEIVFLYPYAVIHRELGAFGLVEVVLFAVAVFASFVYLIANGALDWGPTRVLHKVRPGAVSASRTTATTVRRVGAEGREEVAA
jgi:NADH-quinone oxidoreductase subunit A